MATSKVMRSRISDHLTNNNSNSNKTLQHSMSIGNDNDNDNGDDNNTTTTTTATVTIPPPVFREQKTAEEVWQEIVAGNHNQKQLKQEAHDDDFDDVDADEHNDNAMMTLEDFLAKAEAVDDDDDDAANHELKMPQPLMFSFGSGPLSPFQMNESGSGAARGRGAKKRGIVSESLDKVSQQRQRRMIKNRESAARSRERKQAYQAELEGLAVKLEEENQQLLREKAQRTKDRYKLLMEKLVPIVEKQKTVRILRKVQSMQW